MLIDGKEINVIIEKKRNKRMYLKLDRDGNIKITAPLFTPQYKINNFLNDNIDTIKKWLNKKELIEEKHSEVYYLGKKYNYIYSDKIYFDGNNAYGKDIESINKYLEDNSIYFYKDRLNILINDFDNIPFFTLKVRKMKTRWGVNNFKSKTITLNKDLIHYSVNAIDYVIIHELCHFYHKDHSKNFWSAVESHMSDYKKYRKELKY